MKKYGKKHPYLRKGFKFDCDKIKNDDLGYTDNKREKTLATGSGSGN